MITMDKNSVKNYIEWCSQRTKRLDFGPRYDDNILFGFLVNLLDVLVHTLDTPLQTQTLTKACGGGGGGRGGGGRGGGGSGGGRGGGDGGVCVCVCRCVSRAWTHKTSSKKWIKQPKVIFDADHPTKNHLQR